MVGPPTMAEPAMAAAPDAVDVLTGFAHALRGAGVAADRVRLTTSISSLAHLDPTDAVDLYWALRLTLCSEPDDLARFDALFDQWFHNSSALPPRPAPAPPPGPTTAL